MGLASTKTKTLRLGQINFINCLPVNFALQKQNNILSNFDLEIFSSVPTELNTKLRKGELDIAPISSFEYLKNKDQYEILDGISISSKKEADSVLLCIKGPVGDLYLARKIYLTHKSASSVNLLRIILVKKYGYHFHEGKFFNANGEELEFVNFKENPQDAHIKLLIGDEALLEDKSAFENILDLGQEWHDLSYGLPMVFGLWTINKDSILFEDRASLSELLVQLKTQGLSELYPDLIIEAFRVTGLPKTVLDRYFNNLDYNFGDKHKLSLSLFEKYLLELGLI